MTDYAIIDLLSIYKIASRLQAFIFTSCNFNSMTHLQNIMGGLEKIRSLNVNDSLYDSTLYDIVHPLL